MRINAKEHMAQTQHLNPENPCFEVFVSPELGILQCGGIEIFGKLNFHWRKQRIFQWMTNFF